LAIAETWAIMLEMSEVWDWMVEIMLPKKVSQSFVNDSSSLGERITIDLPK
jgi:hypothetical protein